MKNKNNKENKQIEKFKKIMKTKWNLQNIKIYGCENIETHYIWKIC